MFPNIPITILSYEKLACGNKLIQFQWKIPIRS